MQQQLPKIHVEQESKSKDNNEQKVEPEAQDQIKDSQEINVDKNAEPKVQSVNQQEQDQKPLVDEHIT